MLFWCVFFCIDFLSMAYARYNPPAARTMGSYLIIEYSINDELMSLFAVESKCSQLVTVQNLSKCRYADAKVRLKLSVLRILYSISNNSFLVYALSVMYTKSFASGGYISSYLHAMCIDVTPTSCRIFRLTSSCERYLSIMLTVRYKVSGSNLNLECTLSSQSTKIFLIFSLMSVCLVMYSQSGIQNLPIGLVLDSEPFVLTSARSFSFLKTSSAYSGTVSTSKVLCRNCCLDLYLGISSSNSKCGNH